MDVEKEGLGALLHEFGTPDHTPKKVSPAMTKLKTKQAKALQKQETHFASQRADIMDQPGLLPVLDQEQAMARKKLLDMHDQQILELESSASPGPGADGF